jgi:hypothetical protein
MHAPKWAQRGRPPMARLATTGITHFSSSNCLGSCMPDGIPVVVWPGPIRPITSVAAHLPAPSFAWWTTVSVRNARRSLKYCLIRLDRYQQLIWGSTPLVMTRVRQVPGCRRSRTGETLVRRRSPRASFREVPRRHQSPAGGAALAARDRSGPLQCRCDGADASAHSSCD